MKHNFLLRELLFLIITLVLFFSTAIRPVTAATKCVDCDRNPDGSCSTCCYEEGESACLCDCSGGGSHGPDPWDAWGTMFGFVYYPDLASVPWPVPDASLSSAWAEQSPITSGLCLNPATSIAVDDIQVYAYALWGGAGLGSCSESGRELRASTNGTERPNCTPSIPGSFIRSHIDDQLPFYVPLWRDDLTRVVIPEDSQYRQFGIKILGDTRPVYVDQYVWGGSTVTSADGEQTYPGWPVGTIIRIGNGDRDDAQRQGTTTIFGSEAHYGSRSRDGDDWEDECVNVFGSCPAGYIGIQAENTWMDTGRTINYDHHCPTPPNDLPRVKTCKKIQTNVYWRDDWKPEHQGPITINRTDYMAQNQRVKVIQDFDFTVDKSGNYYFAPCPSCSASMTVNGSWSGWNDHFYEAGTTYAAHFECTSSTCSYGLGIAPKANLILPNGKYYCYEGLNNPRYIPLVRKYITDCDVPANLSSGPACNINNLLDITWSWDSVVGALDYRLQVDNNSNFSSPEYDVITSLTSYQTTDLVGGTWYGQVRVNSSDGSCIVPVL